MKKLFTLTGIVLAFTIFSVDDVRAQYCTPTTSNACTFMYMTSISTAGAVTNLNYTTGSCPGAYSNQSGTTWSMNQNSSATITFNSFTYGMLYTIWIDYNNNGVFY